MIAIEDSLNMREVPWHRGLRAEDDTQSDVLSRCFVTEAWLASGNMFKGVVRSLHGRVWVDSEYRVRVLGRSSLVWILAKTSYLHRDRNMGFVFTLRAPATPSASIGGSTRMAWTFWDCTCSVWRTTSSHHIAFRRSAMAFRKNKTWCGDCGRSRKMTHIQSKMANTGSLDLPISSERRRTQSLLLGWRPQSGFL